MGFYPRQPYKDIEYEDRESGGRLTIEKGSLVFIDSFNYARDQEYFPQPLQFRLYCVWPAEMSEIKFDRLLS